MPFAESTVYLVDDDPDFAQIVRVMLSKLGVRVLVYQSAEAFLDEYSAPPDCPCCLLLDLLLQGMSGFALLENLSRRHIQIPVIVLSGHADVATTVSAIKAGVLDVLEKPVHQQQLLKRVRQALDHDALQRRKRSRQLKIGHRLDQLSVREKEVMQLLAAGQNSKQIANRLGISPKTAMNHRSRVLEKLEIDSVALLIRLLTESNDSNPTESDVAGSA